MFHNSKIGLVILLSFFSVLFSQNTYAQHEEDAVEKADEKFNPGEMIMEHVGDAYSWHIMTVGEHQIEIPLPVILYSKHSGFHIFMSSKFHHGHNSYKGFKIAEGKENPLKGKIVEDINGVDIRPIDISITKNTLSLFISVFFLFWLFISIAKSYNKRVGQAPKGMQSAMEPLILFIRDDVAKASIGEKKYMKYLPYLLSIFFFIFLNNLLGLIPIFPGGANLTGNIAITMVLAIFTFVITTFSGNKHYWKDIFNMPGVPWWLKLPIPLMPLVELMGIFIKPFVLMIRLFANMLAGHIVALGFFALIFIFGAAYGAAVGYGEAVFSVAFTVFLSLLELLVAFIQAYVFTLLSALYFGMATEEHH